MSARFSGFLLSLLMPLFLLGQADFRRIGLEDGLPSLAINSVAEGPKGFLWMASEGAGLLRYDGYRFESYFLEQFPYIEELVLSWRGERLYLHDGRRLAEFDGLGLKEIRLPDGGEIVGLNNVAGSLYVNTSLGLYHWDGDSLKLKSHLPKGNFEIYAANQEIWAAGDSMLYLFNERSQSFEQTGEGGFRFPEGKAQFYWQDGKLICFGAAPSQDWQKVLNEVDTVLKAYQSQESLVLMGLDKIVFSDGRFIKVKSYGAYFQSKDVRSLQIINSQVLILTAKGIFVWQDSGMNFMRRQMPIMGLEVAGANLFLATPMGIERGPQREKITFQGLTLDLLYDNQKLYAATESGLYVQDQSSEVISSTNVEGFVFSLGRGADQLWAAASSGIWQQSQGLVWEKVLDAEALNFASIFSIRHHPKSGFWFASYTQGLWQYHEGKWQHHRQLAGLALDSIGISAMAVPAANSLVLGTLSSGIFTFDLKANSYTQISPRALEYAEVRELAHNDSELWIGTNKGVLSQRDVLESYKAGESARPQFFGLPVGAKGLKVEDGQLYAAGDQGLFTWDLTSFFKAQPQGGLGLLEAGFLRYDQQEDESQFERSPFSGYRIFKRLDHDENYLRFRFGTRSLLHPEWVQYRYRLLGQNEEWTYAGTVREALFSDLKAGNYTLEVEARYPWQSWSMSIKPYVFSIREAVWRTWWFWTLIALAVFVLSFVYLRERWNQREERLKLENNLLEMERKALRLQMNPHFIFNALDSISSFIFKQDPKMAVRYLNNFAKLMRLTLESSMEHLHPVETEVSVLKNYLELEKLRFNSKFEYEIEIDEELDYDIGLPPMLIQPHVENAILHGLKPKEGNGYLHISFKLDGEMLCCTIEDDGIGREAAKKLPNRKAHRSMATKINKDRIDLLKRSMNEVIDLKIIDKYNQQGQACGTKVLIRLPAQEL